MKYLYKTIGVVLLAGLATGCAGRQAMTLDVHQQLMSAGENPAQIQFYIDRDVILTHVASNETSEINNGGVTQEAANSESRLFLKRKTPGVAVAQSNGALVIDFGEGFQGEFLSRNSRKGVYALRAINGHGFRDGGTILFQGKPHKVALGRYVGPNRLRKKRHNAAPKLLYSLKQSSKSASSSAVVPGRKVNAD